MLRDGNARPGSLRPPAGGAITSAARRGTGLGDDARHAFVDLVARRIGRHRQLRQPLLPRARQQAGAARRRPRQPRKALGDLQWRAGGLESAAGMACLAAPYVGRAAAARPAALPLGEAVSTEYDRHAQCLLSAGLDPAWRPPAPRHRGLRAVDTRMRRVDTRMRRLNEP